MKDHIDIVLYYECIYWVLVTECHVNKYRPVVMLVTLLFLFSPFLIVI